ncbi:MAG: DMT family transporter [Proteobacteria bacterium]|nr:DMT family transporter [Pseudomonadota bacterium]
MSAVSNRPVYSRSTCWLLGVIGIIILSPDSLLLRLVDADHNALVATRALFSALSLLLLLAALPSLRRGFLWRPQWIYGACYALGLSCFPLSIKTTHVANTLVIISAAPMIAAVGAYFILGERTRPATWLAAIVIFLSMALIFSDNIDGAGQTGDILAVFVAISLASTSITVRRFPQTAMYPGLVIGSLLTALIFLPFSEWQQMDGRNIAILALDGAVVMTISFALLITAARGLPPAELNLLFLLETILGPLWVWLFLSEAPPLTTIAVGVIIAVVLLLHMLWLLRDRRDRRNGHTGDSNVSGSVP